MSRGMVPGFRAALLGITILALTSPNVFAADSSAPPNDPCLRPSAGSVVSRPPDLFSRDGVLNVAFEYVTTLHDAGRTLFCFRTPDGLTSPTLHVKPAIAPFFNWSPETVRYSLCRLCLIGLETAIAWSRNIGPHEPA